MSTVEHLRIVDRIRDLCRADDRLDAALTYGSVAQGVADRWSDVEFWLFVNPERGAGLDPVAWCGAAVEANLLVPNEFGALVAILPGLLRAEFHVATDVGALRDWPARGAPVQRMVLLDRTGALTTALSALPEHPHVPDTAAEVEALCGRFANWLVLAYHLTSRGEYLRAWDALGHLGRYLLWLTRLVNGSTQHWLTPSRGAEVDLADFLVANAVAATSPAEPAALRAALRGAWAAGQVYWRELAARYDFPVPEALHTDLDAALSPSRWK